MEVEERLASLFPQ